MGKQEFAHPDMPLTLDMVEGSREIEFTYLETPVVLEVFDLRRSG